MDKMTIPRVAFTALFGFIVIAPCAAAQGGRAPAGMAAACAPAKVDGAAVDHATMNHAEHAAQLSATPCPVPTAVGQGAYAAIGEIVRYLEADPSTDWSKVNVESLRQHLIDMDDVTMRARATQRSVTDGAEITVTGAGSTVAAIKRMVTSHARQLDQDPELRAQVREVPAGVVLTVTARNAGDARVAARIRGLGFAGLLTLGDHHAPHHLALARGTPMAHGH